MLAIKGVLTMVDGDFQPLLDPWKDANGNTVTVSGNGQFTVQSADGKTDNYSIASYSIRWMMANNAQLSRARQCQSADCNRSRWLSNKRCGDSTLNRTKKEVQLASFWFIF